MAIYHVKGPDGIEHELEGPEGATDDQVIAKAQEAFGHPDVAGNRERIEPGVMGDTVPVEAKLLENAGHAAGGFGMGGAAGAVAKLGVDAATLGPSGIRNALSGWFKKKAEEQAIKSAAPSGTNLEQLGGPEAARETGRYMLDKKIVTPGVAPEEMLKRVEPLNQAAGKTIGEFRDKGDLRSLAQGIDRPRTIDIEKAIREKLQGKYGSGAEAGQSGELENAISEVNKLSPVEHSTTGAEMAQTVENTGLENDPYYYPQKMESADAYTAARAHQEVLPEMTDGFPYMHDQPTYTELADKATRLNEVAKNARQLNQPSGAMTDAANVLSQKSTEGLEGLLNPAEQGTFGAAKAEYGTTEKLKSILDRSQNRDLANGTSLPVSHFGAISRGVNAIVPATTRASMADKLANALRTDPAAFGSSGATLQRAMQAGKASLNSTIYMLQQQDPAFKAKFEELNNQ